MRRILPHTCLILAIAFGYCFADLTVFAASEKTSEKVGALSATEKLKALYRRDEIVPHPKDNPYSDAKAKLGKILFFDTRLSRSRVMNCASCHNPGFNWTDGNPKGVGDFHKPLERKDPSLLNLAWDSLFFWDGRAESLEQQALVPLQSPHEMAMPVDKAVAQLKAIKEYKPLFASAFPGEPDPITSGNIAKALATFMRTIISSSAPFDRWIDGDEKAISPQAKQGFLLFNGKANCASCHSGWRFSDSSFHDIGLKDSDIGRGKWLPLPVMQHAFKTVGLRNIDRRPPYMHDGSIATLEEVIEHYDNGFVKRDSLADAIKPLHLTKQEKEELLAFLKTLTSRDAPVAMPDMPQ
jgi:cytochrome c peroxidase